MILEILIPLIWAIGPLGIGNFIAKGETIRPELFFPVAGIFGLIIYGLGLLGWLYKPVFISFTVILFISAIWFIVKSKILSILIAWIKNRPLIAVSAAAVMAWFSLASLSYPVNTDALYFHLGLSKLYAQAGGIFFTPGNLFSASPRTSEMIITAFYSLGLEKAGQFFVMLIAALFVWAIAARARDFGGHGIYAALLVLTVPVFVSQATSSKNDFLLWGLSFFAVLKFWDFTRNGKRSDLLWAGIGTGMAAGTKAIGLALYGPLAFLLIYNIAFGKYRFRDLIFFTLAFLILCSPWYIYSWNITGNPVFPFFENIFNSPYSPQIFSDFNRELAIKTVDGSLLELIRSPLGLIFNPELYDGRLGFAIIILPVLLLFVRPIPHGIKILLGISILYYPIWFLGFAYARFLLPILSALAIAGSLAISSMLTGNRLSKSMTYSVLTLALILPMPALIRDTYPRVISVLSSTPQYEFLSNYEALDPYKTQSGVTFKPFSYIEAWKYINQNTTPDTKVGILTSFLTRADGYYLDREFIYLNPSEQVEYSFTKLRNNDDIAREFKKLGIEYLVIDRVVLLQFSIGSNWSSFPHFQMFSDGVAALTAFCNQSCQEAFSDQQYIVYKI